VVPAAAFAAVVGDLTTYAVRMRRANWGLLG
jgi:hypothetical protein